MGSKSKAAEYPTTKLKTNLFGTTTTSKGGTTFKPTAFQKELVGITQNNAGNALNSYLNPDYESADYKRGEEYFNNKMNESLQNNYLAPALQKNLLRGSTAGDITRGFAADLAAGEYERQNEYRDQQLQNYMAAMLPYTTIYDMVKGSTGLSSGLSNSIANYNLSQNKGGSGIGNLLGSLSSTFNFGSNK